MIYNRQQRGFTLLELLVVITIIGILAAILFASFDGARQDAKNKALMSEFREVQLALEVYKAQYGVYPSGSSYPGTLNSGTRPLVPEFITELPLDSDAANTSCGISYESDGAYFKLTGDDCIEGEEIAPNTDFSCCPTHCPSCGSCSTPSPQSIAVYSSGGQCE